MEGIEGLSEALEQLQTALDRVRELTGNSAEEQAESIDESTAETEADEASEEEVTPSGPGTEKGSGEDLNKAAAVAAPTDTSGCATSPEWHPWLLFTTIPLGVSAPQRLPERLGVSKLTAGQFIARP